MPVGAQELVALALVFGIVGFALYRRWRRPRDAKPGCCDQPAKQQRSGESTIHFYRRADDERRR